MRARAWADDLCRPAPIVAIAALVLNDHVGKRIPAIPALVRGKASDVAGLFFFPILLFAIVEALAPERVARRRTPVAIACGVVTAVAFAAVKTLPWVNAVAGAAWGRIELDGTDLATLPSVVFGVVWLVRRTLAEGAPAPRWARASAVLFAAGASIATPAPRMIRRFPAWEIASQDETRLACGNATAWVAKTGKQGAGLVIRVDADARCDVAIVGAAFVIAGERHPALSLPRGEATSRTPADLYVAFPFDGNAVWNDGVREATIELDLVANGEPSRWTLAARLELPSLFEDVRDTLPPPPPPPPPASASPGSATDSSRPGWTPPGGPVAPGRSP